MDGGRRKLRSLDGPLRAVGGPGGFAAGQTRVVYSSRPVKTRSPRAELAVHRDGVPPAPQRFSMPAARPRNAAAMSSFFARLTRPGMGWAGVALLFVCTGLYGATIGNRWQEMGDLTAALPQAFGSGFVLAGVDVDGRKILTDGEILDALGTRPGQSLVFLDVTAARERLMQNPLVIEASVRKLYPDRVAVSVKEREPYALWQHGEKMSVIAQDGTVIEGAEGGRFIDLPMLVGAGAEASAKSILSALEPYPDLRKNIYAVVRVGDRRWNLRLTNGMDVKLPQDGMEKALAAFVKLDASSQLSDRDITEVDLRLPGRATVRLSDEAAAKLAEQAKAKSKAAGT